jgi:hypothetical protein
MRSVPKLYNEEQMRLRESPETAVRRAGVWYKMAASLGVRGVELVGWSVSELFRGLLLLSLSELLLLKSW